MRYEKHSRTGRKKRFFVKFAKWSLGLAFLGITAAYGYVRYEYSSAAGELDGLVARAEKLGLPLTPEQMRHEKLEPGENAADLYRAMAEPLKSTESIRKGEEGTQALNAVFAESSKDLQAATGFFSKLEPVLNLGLEASRRKGCDFEWNWDLGPSLEFPEYMFLKDAVKWLSARAVLRSRTGQFDLALEDLSASARIGGHLSEEPVLIGQLVRIACDAIVMRAANAIATFSERDSERLAKLAEAVQEFPPVADFVPGLQGEVFWGYWTSLNLSRYSDSLFPEGHSDDLRLAGFWSVYEQWRIFPPLIPTRLAERAYAATALKYWVELFEMQQQKKLSAREFSAEMDRRANRYATSRRPAEALASVLFPVFAQAGTAFEKTVASRQSVLALIAAIQYRNRSGNWPKDLKELGFSIADPYTDGEVRFRRDPDGFRIYSVDFAEVDDGGMFNHERSADRNARDLVLAAHPSWGF